MESAEVLLKQNEEIFKRISEDFDDLTKSVEKTNGNHVFLAKSLKALKGDLESIPSKVNNQLESTSNIVSTIKDRYDLDHNRFNELVEKFKTDVQANGVKIERAVLKLNDSVSTINENHETIKTENTNIKTQLQDLQIQFSSLGDHLNNKVGELDEKIIVEKNELEQRLSDKIDHYSVKADNEFSKVKASAFDQNRLTTASIEDALSQISLLQKRSNRFRNLFYFAFFTMFSTLLLMYYFVSNGLV